MPLSPGHGEANRWHKKVLITLLSFLRSFCMDHSDHLHLQGKPKCVKCACHVHSLAVSPRTPWWLRTHRHDASIFTIAWSTQNRRAYPRSPSSTRVDHGAWLPKEQDQQCRDFWREYIRVLLMISSAFGNSLKCIWEHCPVLEPPGWLSVVDLLTWQFQTICVDNCPKHLRVQPIRRLFCKS